MTAIIRGLHAWVSKISRVSQVRELRTKYRVAIPVFPYHRRVRIRSLPGNHLVMGLYSDFTVSPTFKLRLRTAKASMTVRPVRRCHILLFAKHFKSMIRGFVC